VTGAAGDRDTARAPDAAPDGATGPGAQRRGGPWAGRVSFGVVPAREPAECASSEGEQPFAAYIAHELRTPLATQRALLELMLADPLADAASWREVAEAVLDACIEQERLLEACLALARSRCGLTRHDRIDLAAIAAEALRAGDVSGLESVVVLEPAWAIGDSSLVQRLAANLVSNAIHHNVPDGRIEVATGVASGRAVLSVANSGPLIPAAELQRLLQPFQRLPSHRTDAVEGVGLGLAIVHAVADTHGAFVAIRARPGGGLEIDVRFPAILDGTAAHQTGNPTGPANRAATPGSPSPTQSTAAAARTISRR
jgi:signal transduction histidine kinase